MPQVSVDNKSFYIPDAGSPCELWRAYFNKLKKEVGRNNARVIWLITWDQNGSTSCTTNADFNRWLKQNDIDVSNAATRAVADVSAIGGNILGLGKNLSKILSIGIPVILGGVVVVILVLLFKSSKKMELQDLAALTPAGRAAQIGGGMKLIGR